MKVLLGLIQPAFEWTWKNSLQVALLVGLVVLVQTVLARWLTPRLRYALSLLILLRLLLPAVPSSPLSLENLFRPAARLEAYSLAPERGHLGEASLPEATLPDAPISSMVAEPAPVVPTTPLPVASPFVSALPSRLPTLSVAEALGLAWVCGLLALVFLARWRYAQWCRLIRQGRRLSDPRLLALLDDAREAMGVRSPVTLVALARLGSPAVFGFWRVRLLLPETMLDQLTDQDLRLVFLHEMAHVRRHDMLLNMLLMAFQFVHWFNPFLWLGLHRLRADRELVCDAMVLQRTSPEERLTYGSLLLKLLTDFPTDQAIIPTAVPVVSSQRELKRRIVLIKHQRSASRGVYVATVMAAVALACLTFTGSSEQPSVVPAPAVSTAMTNGSPASGFSNSNLSVGKGPVYTQIFYVNTNPFAEPAAGTKATNSLSSTARAALLEHLAGSHENEKKITMHYDDLQSVVVIQGTLDSIDKVHQSFAARGVLRVDKPPQLVSVSLPSGTNYSGADGVSSWLVHDAKLLYEMGKLDEAEAKLKLVLKQDSTNKTAHYYLDLVAQEKRRRSAEPEPEVEGTRSDPINRELLPGADHFAQTDPGYTGQGRQALIAKLDRIRLDRVSFYWQPLGEVVRFLNDETKKRDPEKRGINYLINQNIDSAGPTVTALPKPGLDGQPTPVAPAEQVNLIAIAIKINPALSDIRLADVLDAIVKGADQPIKYSIEDYAIVFSERGPEKTPLYVRTFKVDTNAFLSGLRNSEPPDGIGVGRGIEVSPRISSPSPSVGERVPATTLTADLPRFGFSGLHRADGTARITREQEIASALFNHLVRLGVDLDPKRSPGKAVFYKERQGVLLVRATLQDLDIVERVIAELNAAPSGGQSDTPQSTNLVVRIDAEGNLAIRQTRVTFPQLGSYLTAELAKHPERRMDIQADKSAPMEAVIKVMDAMKQARPETGSPGLSVGETVQGRSVADWVKEAEIGIRPGKEGELALGVLQNAGPQIMPQLSRLLREDESLEIQAKAAWIMSVIGYRNPDAPEVHNAVPALITAAQSRNSEVRIYSLQAIAAIGRAASNAVPVLIQLTKDENGSVRMCAVEALGRIGATSPESIEALTAAASDASNDVRITARKALIMAQGGNASSLMTSNEAGSLAEHLANEKAQALYNCQPFRNSPPARFVRDHWTWHHLQAQGLGDIEATVEFAADGAEPKVAVVRLVSIPRTP